MGTWVDLSKELPGGSSSPARTTPVPFGGESDYMRMLREAQVVDHPLHKYKDENTRQTKDKYKYKDKYKGSMAGYFRSHLIFEFHLVVA